MHLRTMTGQKTLENESKRHPNTIQRPIQHFWSAKWDSKRAEFCLVGLWPNGLRVTIRHTFFDIFAKECIWIQTLIVRTYFLEPSDHYK